MLDLSTLAPLSRVIALLATHMTAEERGAAADELRALEGSETERKLFIGVADTLEQYTVELRAELDA